MKRRITLSLVLVLSVVLLSLMSSDSTANAQPPQRFRFATGFVTPGVGQKLRVTVVGTDGSNTIRVRFVWTQYNMAPVCGGVWAVCRHTVESKGATPLETLSNDQGFSFDWDGTGGGVNVAVESNSQSVRVIAQLIDIGTGEVVAAHEYGHVLM